MSDWFAIIASGPSLRRKDSEALRGLCSIVAVNSSVFLAPWADYLFAADASWWTYYGPKVRWFKGHRISRTYRHPSVEQWRGKRWPRTGGNSGHMAIQYAVDQGAKKIALLGFDQTHTGGKAHFHKDHPARCAKGERTGLSNASNASSWPRHMNRTAEDLAQRGVEVVNLSRETALTCFPRITVEDFISGL